MTETHWTDCGSCHTATWCEHFELCLTESMPASERGAAAIAAAVERAVSALPRPRVCGHWIGELQAGRMPRNCSEFALLAQRCKDLEDEVRRLRTGADNG